MSKIQGNKPWHKSSKFYTILFSFTNYNCCCLLSRVDKSFSKEWILLILKKQNENKKREQKYKNMDINRVERRKINSRNQADFD